MKRLAMHNGTVADASAIKLDCAHCEGHHRYRSGGQDGVYCVDCGRRHSRDSLVDTSVAGVDS